MTSLAWVIILLEGILGIFVIRLIWRTESERPTEEIVPTTDKEVELVG